MTVWDNIYKNYKKTGEEYATLRKGLIPEFLEFIEANEFPIKKVLDVGFGNGKYLEFLKNLGFEVEGIDSSPTAVELAKKSLGGDTKLTLADIYNYDFPTEKFSLVISIAAIHHGLKGQVINAINGIHKSLIPGGRFFITLPDNSGSAHWTSMIEHDEVEPGTRIPLSGPEKGLPHSSFTREEIENIFSIFSKFETKLLEDRGRWIISGIK